MKILIDTNIFLDVILKREKYYENSARIWTYISDNKIIGCISAISINNLYSVFEKKIKFRKNEGKQEEERYELAFEFEEEDEICPCINMADNGDSV